MEHFTPTQSLKQFILQNLPDGQALSEVCSEVISEAASMADDVDVVVLKTDDVLLNEPALKDSLPFAAEKTAVDSDAGQPSIVLVLPVEVVG